MKNKETGEFELVVGNGQIVSGFFIFALLLAVFFAMGFVIARAKYQQDPAAATIATSPPPETRGPAAAPAIPPAAAPADAVPPAADSGAKPLTQAAQESKVEKAVEPPSPQILPQTTQGTYWQVSATANQDAARALQTTIKDMGLPVTLSPGPSNLTRVLVGPYTDTSALARVKTQLENAGLQPLKHTQ